MADGLRRTPRPIDVDPRMPRVLDPPGPPEGNEMGALVEQPIRPDIAIVGVGQYKTVDRVTAQKVVEDADLFIVGSNRKRQHVVPTGAGRVT